MLLNYRYGGKRGRTYKLQASKRTLVLRSRNYHLPLRDKLSAQARRALDRFTPVLDVPHAGVQVFEATNVNAAFVNQARLLLAKEKSLRFSGAALCDPKTRAPAIYTENAFVRFHDGVPESRCRTLLQDFKLAVKRPLPYAGPTAYFVAAPEGTGRRIFSITATLLKKAEVELCHPEVLHQLAFMNAFPQQWHLDRTVINGANIDAHVNAVAAWATTQGDNVTIAVIDDGFDFSHEEFQTAGKIVAPRDVTLGTNTPVPLGDNMHGQCCAGVACADGVHGASGVAPKARLMPIRQVSLLNSQNIADAFEWAANNNADVISCSWGPPDGRWYAPGDPAHQQVHPLPDNTRIAIEYAATRGRGGKGCVIIFAAGNGNESVDNNGYASHPNVIAVGACNDQSVRSVYSDTGRALWCCFPSGNFSPSLTPGIWTTDLSGSAGFNDGNVNKGDAAGNYFNGFDGTSASAAGAAGVAALVLSKNPNLTADQVKDVLRRCCDEIDPAGGQYDANGHSTNYGYGRLNAKTAVDLA
jgi:subtilisin family serine protease